VSSPTTAFKKKLYRWPPTPEPPLETQRSRTQNRPEPCDPCSLERGVRQLLADKVSGTALGLWLLVPEHLRLGTWDLLLSWSGGAAERVEPRLALQLVHEAALCTTGIRAKRALTQPGLALANGVPFIATDLAIHQLLGAHTVAQAQGLQRSLGLLRRASGDYAGQVLIIDPHRVRSYSKRRLARRKKDSTPTPSNRSALRRPPHPAPSPRQPRNSSTWRRPFWGRAPIPPWCWPIPSTPALN
jgi:hypothetical protein